MNRYKKLANNTIIFAIANLGSNLISFIFVRFYTELLTSEQYGSVDILTTTCSLVIPLVTLAIVEAVFRFSLDEKDKKSVLSAGITVASIGNLLCCIFCPIIMGFTNYAQYSFWLFALILVTSFDSILTQFTRGIGKTKTFAVSGIIKTLSLVTFNILFLLVLKMGIEGYLLSLILSEVSSAFTSFFIAKLYQYISFKFDYGIIKTMILYSLPLVPSSMSWWIMNASDKYVILFYLGASANGLYTVAHKLPTVINLCNTLFMQAWQISAVEEKNSSDRSCFYSNIFNNLSMILFICGSGLLLFLKIIMSILVSSSYGNVWIYSPFLIIAMIFSAFSSFIGTNYTTFKDTKGALKTTTLCAVINIILNFILIKFYGINGAAFATMISFFIMWIARVVDTKKYVNIHFNLFKIIFSLIIVGIQCYLVISESKFLYLFSSCCFAVILLLYCKDLISLCKNVIEFLKKKKSKAEDI